MKVGLILPFRDEEVRYGTASGTATRGTTARDEVVGPGSAGENRGLLRDSVET
jgi:hypothetical protein